MHETTYFLDEENAVIRTSREVSMSEVQFYAELEETRERARDDAEKKANALVVPIVRSKKSTWYDSAYLLPALWNTTPIFDACRDSRPEHAAASPLVIERKGCGGMHYIGPQLRQAHKRVYAELLRMRRGEAINGEFEYNPYRMLEALGWGVNQRNKDKLRDCLRDMYKGGVVWWSEGGSARNPGGEFRLIALATYAGTKWKVQLTSGAIALFEMHMTYLSCANRKPLQDGLQTLIYDFWSSHPPAYEATLDELHYAAGSAYSDLAEFGRDLRAAATVVSVKCSWGMKSTRGKLQMFK